LVENSQIQLTENLNLETSTFNRFVKPSHISKMVSQYGTPLYLIDEDTLHSKVKELCNAYAKFNGPLKIAYSIKANFTPAILRAFIKDGIAFDLTSIGELRFAKHCNAESESIIYTSITEEYEEYLEVLQTGVKRVVVSSFNGMTNLARAANKLNVKPLTLIRINPFNGVTIDSATKMVKHLIGNNLLRFEGFHFHLGSQITDFSCYTHALDKMDAFITKMRKEHPNFVINTLDIGGGTPVFYNNPVPSPTQMTENYVSRLNHLIDTHGKFELIVESGRFLVAESSILISKIVNTKEYNDHKIVIVDAGYHLLLDAALLKQEYPQEVVPVFRNEENMAMKQAASKNLHLAGRLCDTYDVFPLSRVSTLDEADIGRYISFYNVGAYSIVFNMPFHCQTKPPIVMKTSDGDFKLVRKGTSYEQLFIEEGGSIL
jgi:diaminopimelate decarboxylase